MHCSDDDPNLIYRISGRSLISGEYKGVEGWREFSKRSIEETGGTRQYETKATMYGDDRVAVLSHATGKRRGKELNVDVVILYRFEHGLMIHLPLIYQRILQILWRNL